MNTVNSNKYSFYATQISELRYGLTSCIYQNNILMSSLINKSTLIAINYNTKQHFCDCICLSLSYNCNYDIMIIINVPKKFF